MKKMVLVIALVLLAGVAMIAYPYVGNYLFQKNASQAIDVQSKRVDSLSQTEVDNFFAAAHKYNNSLAGDPVQDPFLPGSGIVQDPNYPNILDLGDGIMGSIEIPKIGVDLPIYHGVSPDVLDKGVGHMEATSFPVGGKTVHTVLTGHTGMATARLFTDLDKLAIGDTFYIHVLGQVFAYRVDNIEVVLPTQTEDLRLVLNRDLVTLVTCTPYGINTHRLFVRGTRVPYVPGMEEQAAKVSTGLSHEQILVIITAAVTAAAMGLVIAFVLLFTGRKKKREADEAEAAAAVKEATAAEAVVAAAAMTAAEAAAARAAAVGAKPGRPEVPLVEPLDKDP